MDNVGSSNLGIESHGEGVEPLQTPISMTVVACTCLGELYFSVHRFGDPYIYLYTAASPLLVDRQSIRTYYIPKHALISLQVYIQIY